MWSDNVKVCPRCGKEFKSNVSSKIYCSRLCSKSMNRRRKSLREHPLENVICCICGKIALRRSQHVSPKTCGKAECVKSHKKNCRKAIAKLNRTKWVATYKLRHAGEIAYGKTIQKTARVEKSNLKQHNHDLADVPKAIAQVRRMIMKRDNMAKCPACGIIHIRESKSWAKKTNRCHSCYLIQVRNAMKSYRQTGKPAIARSKRMKEDVVFKIKTRIRQRLSKAIGRYAKGITIAGSKLRYLGCSAKQAARYLQSQFQKGMTWDNYGSVWHIDHIRPIDSYDINQEDQRVKAFHYTNLRPLYAEENLRKNRHLTVKQHQPGLLI